MWERQQLQSMIQLIANENDAPRFPFRHSHEFAMRATISLGCA